MANNKKRVPVKWIRDLAKKAYEKDTKCFICDSEAELELHHLCSVSYLLEVWCTKNGYKLDTDEDVLAIREAFISAHHDELYNQVFTLCNKHHVKLHSIYGKIPNPGTAAKQAAWIKTQRDKFLGLEVHKESIFGKFLNKESQ